jgi:hypothetical protein
MVPSEKVSWEIVNTSVLENAERKLSLCLLFKKRLQSDVVAQICNPSYLGNRDRKIAAWGQPQAKAWEPIWKTAIAQRARGVAQVVEPLPSKHKTLSLNPNTANK